MTTILLFATVPDSSINSWESWFIFNLGKINTNQCYESISLDMRNCKHKYTTLHECMVITVHTWTAIFLEHLANTSFMASLQAWTKSLSGLSLWACFLLPCPTRYFAVYLSGLGFTSNTFLLSRWLLTNVKVNNITTLYDICAHMYIHHISITILLFFLHIFHPS